MVRFGIALASGLQVAVLAVAAAAAAHAQTLTHGPCSVALAPGWTSHDATASSADGQLTVQLEESTVWGAVVAIKKTMGATVVPDDKDSKTTVVMEMKNPEVFIGISKDDQACEAQVMSKISTKAALATALKVAESVKRQAAPSGKKPNVKKN